LSLEPSSEIHAEDPSSERWLQYYKDARVRRRARPHEKSRREQVKRYHRRQLMALVSGFAALGVLVSIFYLVLER
jgi:hypothetical protein